MFVAASAVASTARADEPNGLSLIPKATRPLEGAETPQKLEVSRAGAFERWNFTASTARSAWDPTDPLQMPRFNDRDALLGTTTRAGLTFDWQRKLSGGRLEAAAFAKRSSLELSGHENLHPSPERFVQRDRRSLFGAAVRWSGDGSAGDFDTHHTASVRVRGESFDADGVLALPGGSAAATLREDRLGQAGAGVNFDNEVQLSDRVRARASVRYDAYRFDVKSDLAGRSGALSGGVLSPHVSLIADLTSASEAFLRTGRGFDADDARSAAALSDPRTGTPVARLDPLATLETTEVGLRGRWLPDTETTFSMLRIKSDSELVLTGNTGFTDFTRPTLRQGLQFSARYEPAKWLTLDFHASALKTRFADGASEYVPGAAERNVSAAATMRLPNGWTTSLLVNTFGSRLAADDGAARLKATSFVNARLARNLSKATRVTFDIFNVFDQRVSDVDYFSTTRIWSQPGADSFLFNPAEPRGFRIKLRTTF